MALRWLEASLADLRAIKAYIAEENPDAARRAIASIRSETCILINQPTIGRAGRIADIRSAATLAANSQCLCAAAVSSCAVTGRTSKTLNSVR